MSSLRRLQVITRRSVFSPWASLQRRHITTRFDQTKESNDPSKELRSEHKTQAKQAGDDKSGEHPAKQADPQPSPSKSTGVRREGPGSKAGEGEDKGVTKEKVLPSSGT